MKRSIKHFAPRILIRSCIVVAWTFLIIGFLYAPQLAFWSKFEKSLNILVWPQIIDTDILADFEKQTGVTVNVNYFESNDELLAKLSGSKTHDYDIIMFSDFYLNDFIAHNFLKKIDWSPIDFKEDLYPQLLNRKQDPLNEYSIPCFWNIFGIGIDINAFNGILPEPSWDLLFDKDIAPSRIGMLEDMLHCFSAAAMYRYGIIKEFTSDQINEIIQTLIAQKKHVVAYTDMRVEYLLASGTCQAVLASSSDIAKMAKRYPHIKFLIPKEGAFAVLESFGITAQTTKDDLIYQFLNYLYQPNVMQQCIEQFEFPSPLQSLDVPYALPDATFLSPHANSWQSFAKIFGPEIMEKVWLAVRTA